MVSSERLKEVLDYCPESGNFTWKVNKAACIKVGQVAGALTNKGYIRIKIDGKKYLAHRLAFTYMGYPVPKHVDHIDGKGDNNSWDNLRGCSHTQNHYNQKLRSDNSTGIKNVRKCPNGKYSVRVTKAGKRYSLGGLEDLELAELAAKELRSKLHGEFARDN